MRPQSDWGPADAENLERYQGMKQPKSIVEKILCDVPVPARVAPSNNVDITLYETAKVQHSPPV